MNDPLKAALHDAENNLRLGTETAEASMFVVQKRLEILTQAATDPLHADVEEITLMGAEKVEALSASVNAAAQAALTFGASCADMARQRGETLQNNISALEQATNDAARLALQTEQIAQFWGQAMVDGMTLWRQGLHAQTKIIEPVHSVVTANAERLK